MSVLAPSTPCCGHGSVRRERAGNGARRRLLATLAITAVICLAEGAGGYFSGSLALLSDAGHMLTDILALLLSLFALIVAARPADSRRTYGYYRVEIISSFLNGILLFSLSGGLMYSAWIRLQNPGPIEGGMMMIFAAIGLAGNIAGAILLAGQRDNLNMRAAFLHVISDGVSSAAVLAGSIFIYFGGRPIVDTVLGVLIAGLIIVSSIRLLNEATSILMESTPAGLDVSRVRAGLLALPGISAVHDLHIWSISSDMPALSAHIVVPSTPPIDGEVLLRRIHKLLDESFHIQHTTIQIENEGFQETCARELNGRTCA